MTVLELGACSCGQPATRTLGSVAYCVECAETVLAPIRARHPSGHGWQSGQLRPDYGDGWAELECDNCHAGWVGRIGETCGWCVKAADEPRKAKLAAVPPIDLNGAHKATQAPISEESPVDPSFHPIDLGPVLDGTAQQPEPTVMRRDDRQALFYAGQINGLHGDSGTGKGWIILYAIVQQLAGGRQVMMIDAEDIAQSIIARLRMLGATDEAIAERFIYIRPSAPFHLAEVDYLVDLAEWRDVSLCVIDSLGECFGLDGVDENHDAEVRPWMRHVARRLADAGPAVVIIDHSTKANDNPLHPSGSKAKRAAVGGASYLVTASVPLTATAGGRLQLTCAKDRHGTYARGEHVADLVMVIDPLIGSRRCDLYAPAPATATDLPIELAARAAVKAVEEHGQMTFRLLRERMAFKGRNETRTAGIELAVSRGDLFESPGPRHARLFDIPVDKDVET